jgi:alkylation response protein AidB-like acyl-CoA dehydrogenase
MDHMGNKLADMKDIRFVLYEQLELEKICDSKKFEEHSRDTFEMILETAEKFAVNDLYPTSADGDKVGCTLEDGTVRVPEVYRKPFKRYCEAGWISMPENPEVGGQNVPLVLHYACNEMFFAANYAINGYMGLTHSAANVIEVYGTEEQKRKYMQPLYSGQYAGAMVLTEAGAGSDVGAIRAKAVPNADGTFSIEGAKIFITGGEQDLTENIVHIVLARIEGDAEGTKGLSCFIVPKYRVNDDGTLGDMNDIVCTGVEHKMGFKGSSTCALSYGDNGNCRGELLGPAGQGIVVMFHMMNEQRVWVGLEGLAQGSTAYLHGLEYARERVQGPELGKRDSKQVPIIRHPDVKRHLLCMKAYTEGLRALIYSTVHCLDRIAISSDQNEKSDWKDIIEVLTPVCKAYGTDKSFDVCVRSMQIHGGYGYCADYRVEQFTRDCKVASIFEGTNGIQANDLFGRKIRMRNGDAFKSVISKMRETVNATNQISGLSEYAKEFEKAVTALEEITGYLLGLLHNDAYMAYSWASPFLELFGDVALGWMFLWQAGIACRKIEAGAGHSAFYSSKLNTAKFYVGVLMPLVHGKIDIIKKNDKSLAAMGEELFFD